MYVETYQGGNTCCNVDDQNGDPSNISLTTDGLWHDRIVDLSSFAGQTISGIGTSTQGTPARGNIWDVYYADIAIVSANGVVTQIYNGESGFGTSWWGPAGESDLSATVDQTTSDSSSDGAFPSAHYYTGDHLGTTQMELSSGGWPVWAGQFAPFGQELDAPTTPMHYKFTGKERDTESGLDYFGARYYASSMGRWMSPDWANKPEAVPYSSLDNPQSLNLYEYVGNNPLGRADADGHCDPNGGNCSVWDHVAGAVGGLLNVVPVTANLGISAFNAVSSRLGGPQLDELQTIQPDAHASGGGVTTGEAAQILVPVGDLAEGATLLKGAEEGELAAGTERAAQREAMRQEGIPTSQQPASQEMTKAGRQYTYETPEGKTKVIVKPNGQ